MRRDVSKAEPHKYELIVRLKNSTRKRLDDWYIETELPSALLHPTPAKATHFAFVRSDAKRGGMTLFRVGCPDLGRKPILSGEDGEFRQEYQVSEAVFDAYDGMLDGLTATARAYVGGELAHTAVLAGTGLAPDHLQNY